MRRSFLNVAVTGGMMSGMVAGLMGLAAGDAFGGALYEEYVVDVSGLEFRSGLGNPSNVVLEETGFPIAAYMRVAAIQWDVTIGTIPFSWLSEASLRISAGNGPGYILTPGEGDDFFGVESYSSNGWLDLAALGMDFYIGMDETIRIELFDSDSITTSADAFFGSNSTVTLGLQIPSPGVGVVLGIGGAIGLRRRRR